MSEFEERYRKAVAEIEAHKKKAIEEDLAAQTYDPTGILTPKPTNSIIDAIRKKLIADMEEVKNKRKQEEQYTRITDSVNILILPLVQCPECMATYEMSLESDGIRLRFRHNRKDGCSRQMTQFHRPLAVFMKEI